MATDTTFDRLTRTLSTSERGELLKRVQGLGALVEESLAADQGEEPQRASELEIMRLGLIARLVLFFLSLFTGKPRGEILREMVVRRLGEAILRSSPGLLESRRGVFLRRMRDEIEALAVGLSSLRGCMRSAFGEEQDEFLAFLTGHLLPHVQDRLAAAVNLKDRAGELEPLDTPEVRRRVHEDLENAVTAIPEPERRGVYDEVRALQRLRGLALFPVTEMLEAFDTDTVPGECAFGKLKKHLVSLDACLHAARRAPSAAALEGLFMFAHREEIDTEGFALEERLTEELGLASQSLASIRSFNQKIPLTKVVRFTTGNLEYLPREIGGGEDWFILFKRYWTSRADGALREFAREQERKRLVQEAESYLEVHRLPRVGTEGMTGIALEVAREGELALALVLGFSQEVFFKLSRSFAMLLERARFVKEDNRRELAQVYGYLNGLDARMDALMGSLRADVDIMQAPQDPEARRPLEQRARKTLESFLDESAANIKLLTSILEGILRGSPGNRYDTVFNLDAVGDWQGKMMSEVLEEGYDRIAEGLGLLGRIRSL